MHATPTPQPALELKSERVQRELQRLPGWKPTDDYRGLELLIAFDSPLLAYAFIAAFAELATRLHLEGGQLVLLGKAVVVTLRHPATFQGVSAAQLDFAHQLTEQAEFDTARELGEEEEEEEG
jgi:pterin-4a-carbinolamine dehydratase